jgi:hypothetical protein
MPNENLLYSRVAPQNLEMAWIAAMPWIEKALGEINHAHAELAHIQKGLYAGALTLWAIQDKRKNNLPVFFLITELHTTESGFKTLILRWAAGTDMGEWINDIELLEHICGREGYQKMEVWGRPGWGRVLKPHGFRKEFEIFSKLVQRGLN